jgi:transcriptional regulator with XRE-family HTH domain
MTPQEFKQERQRLALTIKAMAERIGVSEQAIWYYETGKRKVPQPVALLLNSQQLYDKLLAEKERGA